MKITLIVLLFFHGLIHLLGFAKAFDLATVPQLTQKIPKYLGILWLVTTFLFIAGSTLLYQNLEAWRLLAGAGIVLSQFLIISCWSDAKFGTVLNLVLAIFVLVVHF